MADTDAPPPRERQRRASRDPKVFVLLRELSEVHLLLDHVSANPSATVAELDDADKLPRGLGSKWIEDVCRISWPPDGSNDEKAEDAALLIRAKDYLNCLAHPASGSTIAFTHLVTQGGPERPPRRWLRWGADSDGQAEDEEPRAEQRGNGRTATRKTLAATAYPDLVGKALTFRRWMWWISFSLLIALALTCFASWYAAYGNAVLAEFAVARDAVAVAQQRIDQAESEQLTAAGEVGRGTAPNRPGQTQAPVAGAPVTAATEPFVPYCDRPPSAQQTQNCSARRQARASMERAKESLGRWVFWRRDKSWADKAPSRAAALAAILGSAVLPFLYGLLGAAAAVVRTLSGKIRASLLSPRDLLLSVQQLALGAVIGACIGLFVAAPGSGSRAEGLFGPVALSASAISFIAGFGVDAVFQALESLIARIFNVKTGPSTS